jgi:hypothetical protein
MPNLDPPPSRLPIQEGEQGSRTWLKWFEDLKANFNALRTGVSSLYVGAGFGGLRLNTPTSLGTVDATWTTLVADTALPDDPFRVVVDLTDNSLTAESEGTYSVSLTVVLSHDEAQTGRTTNVRVYNLTDAIPVTIVPVAVGRNTPGTNFAAASLFTVDSSNVNKELVIQIGGGDILNTVTLEAYIFNIYSVGPFEGIL